MNSTLFSLNIRQKIDVDIQHANYYYFSNQFHSTHLPQSVDTAGVSTIWLYYGASAAIRKM